jgi:hypothetical protein
VFEVRFDHLFASNVLKECETVTKDAEVFVPLHDMQKAKSTVLFDCRFSELLSLGCIKQ